MENENPDPPKAVKIPEAVITQAAPFADDALGRENLARFLTQRVESSTMPIMPYALALDANWGEGKTTFLKMWQADLHKSSFQCVYYDAWASDFCRDSFPSMVAELKEYFSRLETKTAKKTAEKIAKEGAAVAKAMVKTMPGFVAGFVGGGGSAQAVVDKIFSKWEPVAAYSEYRKTLESFKSSLGEIASQSEKPLIFMIDELDRCRPTFALDVLEKIKHIFDVPGVFFVAALNKNALAKTIESVYGITDGNDYLSKFFDDTHPLVNHRGIAFSLLEKVGIIEMMNSNETQISVLALSELFDSHSVSLRGQKQIVESIAECLKKFAPRQKVDWTLLFFFVFLRCKNFPLFTETLATTENARSEPDLRSLIPARKLMAFVSGQKHFSLDNSTVEDVAKLEQLACSRDFCDVYFPLIHLRGQCDSDFYGEMNRVSSRFLNLPSYGGSVGNIHNLVKKVSHNV